MSLKRVTILLGKEFLQGPKNYIFVMAIVLPILLSLVVSLVFGTLVSEKPKLGLVDEGSSKLVSMIADLASVTTKEYGTASELTQAAENGAVDLGVVVPPDLDNSIGQGKETRITAYIWGESLAKNRAILRVTILNLVRELAGQEAPIEIETINLGEEAPVPWSDRLLPLIVLMAVFFGGLMVPATSVVTEKERKTLQALAVTPTSLGDVFVTKGLVGFILSLFAGVAILILNQAFGAEPRLLLLLLVLGATMAAEIGLLLGAFVKDWTTLFTVWKSGAILLFAPAFVYLFPQIPEWIARIFPTYYLIQPIVEISQRGGDWASIATSVFALAGLDVVLMGAVTLTLKKVTQHP